MSYIINVENLTRDFIFNNGILKKEKKMTRALDDLTFNVKKGEVFGLIGPNGAGKTTTIKILTTLLAPTLGEVKVLGYKPFGEEKKLRPHINFIYGGERNLYWRISARDNLIYFSDLYKVDKNTREKRIPELLELVGLSDRADERVENFSKGMKQRLQIARGLVNDPEILFMDEPTIGLDPIGAKDLRQIVRELSHRGKTIILTTHYMFEADELCDRIALIRNGQILALDTPSNLKSNINDNKIIEIQVTEINDSKIEELKANPFIFSVIVRSDGSVQNIKIQTASVSDVLVDLINILKDNKIINVNTKEVTLEDVYIYHMAK